MHLKIGRTDESLKSYQGALKIKQTLAQADPGDIQIQFDLVASHRKIGNLHVETGDLEAAKQEYEIGIDVLGQLIAKGHVVEQAKSEQAFFEEMIAKCDNPGKSPNSEAEETDGTDDDTK